MQAALHSHIRKLWKRNQPLPTPSCPPGPLSYREPSIHTQLSKRAGTQCLQRHRSCCRVCRCSAPLNNNTRMGASCMHDIWSVLLPAHACTRIKHSQASVCVLMSRNDSCVCWAYCLHLWSSSCLWWCAALISQLRHTQQRHVCLRLEAPASRLPGCNPHSKAHYRSHIPCSCSKGRRTHSGHNAAQNQATS